ncbi:MAG TPA: hypothetical protein VIF09_23185, partial [Polyangiaceae bacterium]
MSGAARPGLGLAFAALLAIAGCGGGGGARSPSTPVGQGGPLRHTGRGRPPVAVVVREGDARGALAVSVSTAGIAPERGAVVGVALAALVEARWRARGAAEGAAVGGWDGLRLRILVESAAEAAKLAEAAREAMLAPVTDGEPGMASVARKVEALARRPLPDRALVDVAACTGEAFGTGSDAVPSAAEVEAWRRAAFGVERVAFATAGDDSLANAVASAIERGPEWPSVATARALSTPPTDGRALVYDASGEMEPGAARIVVVAHTATAEQAVAAAPALGDARGPLASRLAGLDAQARVRSVVATAHVDGGCVATTLDLDARDLAVATAARVATAGALARQEIAVELADETAPVNLGRELAARSSDPREAAERASWWALARPAEGGARDVRTGIIVGVASARDAQAPMGAAMADAIRRDIDGATVAWHGTAVETRTRLERGQGDLWILVASPCGTGAETSADAGTGAAFVEAAVAQTRGLDSDVRAEPFVTTDGIGVLVHGPARAGESPLALARRLADLAGRPLLADPFPSGALTRARSALLARSGDTEASALAALGSALVPGHPSWTEPAGTTFGLASASDEAIAMRAATLRGGPWRVAILANVDGSQGEAAAHGVDRWLARRPGEARSCSPVDTPPAVRPGTYSLASHAGASSEALLALSLPPADDTSRARAAWLAAALDGPDGLLARVLGGRADAPADSSLATAWSAGVVGAPRAPALTIRLTASDPMLDAAVAQTRALLDRLRQGALHDDDHARAAAVL